jgi:Ca2+-dependent lipid-binding protein
MGVLTIVLDKMAHLRDADYIGKSDPYVMFELEQDNFILDKNFGKKRSTTKKNDCNPEYDETFTFEDLPSMNNMILHVKVYDNDNAGRDDSLGHCKINLERLGLSEEVKEVQEVIDNKKGEGWFSKKARIHLKLAFTE